MPSTRSQEGLFNAWAAWRGFEESRKVSGTFGMVVQTSTAESQGLGARTLRLVAYGCKLLIQRDLRAFPVMKSSGSERTDASNIRFGHLKE
jgi:hypothetical protein